MKERFNRLTKSVWLAIIGFNVIALGKLLEIFVFGNGKSLGNEDGIGITLIFFFDVWVAFLILSKKNIAKSLKERRKRTSKRLLIVATILWVALMIVYFCLLIESFDQSYISEKWWNFILIWSGICTMAEYWLEGR